jgi:biopolymer transport protein ExbB
VTNIQDAIILISNFSVISIMATAIFCYSILIELCFMKTKDLHWIEGAMRWSPTLKKILPALPLLGLFGTITGLLDTFKKMSVQNGFDIREVITGGIAEAMFTTQLGLIMVIPGILMLNYLNKKIQMWRIVNSHEIVH